MALLRALQLSWAVSLKMATDRALFLYAQAQHGPDVRKKCNAIYVGLRIGRVRWIEKFWCGLSLDKIYCPGCDVWI